MRSRPVVRASAMRASLVSLLLSGLLAGAVSSQQNGSWSNLGHGKAGTRGVPSLRATALRIGRTWHVLVSSARPRSPAYLVVGTRRANMRVFGGTLVPHAAAVLTLATDHRGRASATIRVPDDRRAIGAPLVLQALVVDPRASFSLAFTNALGGSAAGPGPLSLRWPVRGTENRDWVVTNYVDLQSGPGLRDYMNGTKIWTSGHDGTDISIPSFRTAETGWAEVYAAAAGTVTSVKDGECDHHTAIGAGGGGNHVKIDHGGGWMTVYYHLKIDSLAVLKNQAVARGQKLGVVASSGNSSGPHLHFEVKKNGDTVCPFEQSLWESAPAYQPAVEFMELAVVKGGIPSSAIGKTIKYAPPAARYFAPDEKIGIGLVMAGGNPGDSVEVKVRRPGNVTFMKSTVGWDQADEDAESDRKTMWYWNRTISAHPGTWKIEVRVGGVLKRSHTFYVGAAYAGPSQVVQTGVPEKCFQEHFDDIKATGHRLVRIDGYRVGGKAYVDAVFENGPAPAWRAYWNRSGAQYQALYDKWVKSKGYRLAWVDSYPDGGSIEYAMIFEKRPGPSFRAYHGLTSSQHQSRFDQYTSQGYHPVCLSRTQFNGTVYVAALYEKKNVGAEYVSSYIKPVDMQSVFDSQKAKGRRLAYLHAWRYDGSTRLVAIFNQEKVGKWTAFWGQKGTGVRSKHDLYLAWYRREARCITGYSWGGAHRHGVVWTER